MRLLAALSLGLALGAPPGLALAQPARPVALELLLAIDASGSIDVDEFELQRAGLAAALTDPEVVTAIEALPHGIAISAVQWSGRRQQVVVVDWRQVRNRADAAAAAALLAGMNRRLLGETALGEALAFALRELDRSPFTAPRQVIDVSGDGKTNAGPEPDWTRDEAIGRGVTINALAIVNEQPDLERYYEVHLIGGPGAFVLTARDFDDFAAAIRQKLLHEIRGGPTAAAPPPGHAGATELAVVLSRGPEGGTAQVGGGGDHPGHRLSARFHLSARAERDDDQPARAASMQRRCGGAGGGGRRHAATA